MGMTSQEFELIVGPEYLKHARQITVTMEQKEWRKRYTTKDGTVTTCKSAGIIFVNPKEETPRGNLRVRVSILNESGARLDSDLVTLWRN